MRTISRASRIRTLLFIGATLLVLNTFEVQCAISEDKGTETQKATGEDATTRLVQETAGKDTSARPARAMPNIIIYIADDLGVGEVNQQEPDLMVSEFAGEATRIPDQDLVIHTPHLARLAKEGVRMLRSYTSSPICGPARHALITGIPVGRSAMRANALLGVGRDFPLSEGQDTLPLLLAKHDYVNYYVGKWGLGDATSTGAPWKQGIDHFYGLLTHRDAHRVYPEKVWESHGSMPSTVNLPRNLQASERQCVCEMDNDCLYDVSSKSFTMSKNCDNASQMFRSKALGMLRSHMNATQGRQPFFLMFAGIAPHNGYYQATGSVGPQHQTSPVSTYGRYASLTNRVESQRVGHMAMITHELDSDVGALLAEMEALGVDDSTLFVFLSDNGPHDKLGSDTRYHPNFFHAAGGLRGIKSDVYEGGIRSPTIIRWPGRIKPGTRSILPHAGYDFPLTIAHLVGIPGKHRSLQPFKNKGAFSFARALLREESSLKQRKWMHIEICYSPINERGQGCDYAFFDLREKGSIKKIIRYGYKIEMYDITRDPFELENLRVDRQSELFDAVALFQNEQARTPYCPELDLEQECGPEPPLQTLPTKPPTTMRPTPPPTNFPTPRTPVPTSLAPTTSPSTHPTTSAPTIAPTFSAPSSTPTKMPSISPSKQPSQSPSKLPSQSPSGIPTFAPTSTPTLKPTYSPSQVPSTRPSVSPSKAPTSQPTKSPTKAPMKEPTALPSSAPTDNPTAVPTLSPSERPTVIPSKSTRAPTSLSTNTPTMAPFKPPTQNPPSQTTPEPFPKSSAPSPSPSSEPSLSPTRALQIPDGVAGEQNGAPSNDDSDQPQIVLIVFGVVLIIALVAVGMLVAYRRHSKAASRGRSGTADEHFFYLDAVEGKPAAPAKAMPGQNGQNSTFQRRASFSSSSSTKVAVPAPTSCWGSDA